MDGDINDYFPNQACTAVGFESQLRGCWTIMGSETIDYDGDCSPDYTFAGVGHPCSMWEWQSNNIMDYTGYNNIDNAPALTEGQVLRVLQNFQEHRCDQIKSIGSDCRPANAQVYAFFDQGSCGVRVHTGLSQNNDRHRVTIKNSAGVVVYDSGWRSGEAPSVFSVPQVLDKYGNANPGKPFYNNESYTVILQTDGECGDESIAQAQVTTQFGCGWENAPWDVGYALLQPGGGVVEVSITDAPIAQGINLWLTDDVSGNLVSYLDQVTDEYGSLSTEMNYQAIALGQPFTVTIVHSDGVWHHLRGIKTY